MKESEDFEMEFSAQEVNEILELIRIKWKIRPSGVAKCIGYSRQAIHSWKKEGTSKKQYAILNNILHKGPTQDETWGPTHDNELLVRFELKIDTTTPGDKIRKKIEKIISFLENIKKIYT